MTTVCAVNRERHLIVSSFSSGHNNNNNNNNHEGVQTIMSLSKQELETVDLCNFLLPTTTPIIISLPIISLQPIAMMKNIIRLDLSRNRLMSLPKELFCCSPVLKFVDVGRNNLKGLPLEIGHCKQLKSIIALSNNLRWSQFPIDEITSLPLLEELDLRWNQKMNNQSTRRRLLEDKKFEVPVSILQDSKSASASAGYCKLVLSAEKTKTNKNDDDQSYNTCADDRTAKATAPTTTTPTKKKRKKLSACDRNANELRSQLEPLSTPQLRKRLHRTFRVSYHDNDENAYDREIIMQKTLQCYENKQKIASLNNDELAVARSIRQERGVAIDPTLLSDLLTEMERIQWPRTTRERPKVLAEGYLILQRPRPSLSLSSPSLSSTSPPSSSCGENNNKKMNNKTKREVAKIQRFIGIWTKAIEAIESIDKSFANKFTALAVTKNFQGSPHIDTLNVAPFYGLSLGDFTGGKLCVECSPTQVAHIDTKGKIAKVDGRFCHWVSDHVGTRYSLIYYITSGEIVPQTTAIFQPPHHKEEEDGKWITPPIFVL